MSNLEFLKKAPKHVNIDFNEETGTLDIKHSHNNSGKVAEDKAYTEIYSQVRNSYNSMVNYKEELPVMFDIKVDNWSTVFGLGSVLEKVNEESVVSTTAVLFNTYRNEVLND